MNARNEARSTPLVIASIPYNYDHKVGFLFLTKSINKPKIFTSKIPVNKNAVGLRLPSRFTE
jgi:hypothetical protein